MKKIFFILIFSVSFFSLYLQAQSLTPGLWKAKTSLKLNGVPLPSSEEEDCVSAEKAKDAKTTITQELKKKGCQITKWKVQGGQLQASLACVNNDVNATGQLKGKFSAKSYDLTGEAEGTYKNTIPSSVTVSLSGQWMRNCESR
ncbi:MAG: DUF3617 domain-containing protein [Pseudobdellovibrionaceae bacterium]